MNKEQDYKKLVEQFSQAAERMSEAIMKGDWRENNKWAKKQANAFQQIIAIGDIARDELLTLLEHQSLSVVLSAAVFSLKYDTAKSIATLEQIAATDSGIIGFQAEQALQRWKEGSWQLE
jgi:hypothetical protein